MSSKSHKSRHPLSSSQYSRSTNSSSRTFDSIHRIGELQAVGEEVWIVNGPPIRFYGMPFPTRMTVIRLHNGDLFLHSPIEYSTALKDQLMKLGVIRHLVSPNWLHYAFIHQWQHAIPNTMTWAAPKARQRAAQYAPELRFDRDLQDAAPPEWQSDLQQMIVHGSSLHTEVVFFHNRSKVLILTDLIENMHPLQLPLWMRVPAHIAGIIAPRGKIPLDMWLTFYNHHDELRKAVQTMIDWQPNVVVLAHGELLTGDIEARLLSGFRYIT